MDGKTSSSKNCDDADADVDHYFLPGGILDTPSHEEDMIGGSLLDEIGGMRNLTRLVPRKQMSAIGRAGPEVGIRIASSGAASSGSQSRSKPTSVAIEDSARRLSVEGTNPMAKEFTPAARPLPSGSAISSQPGGPHSRTSFNTASDPRQRSPSRVFSAAVGSEVKKPTAEFPGQGALGNSGQTSRYQPDWVTRAISFPGHPSPSLATNQRLTNPRQGRLPLPPGLPPRGPIPQRSENVYRVQGEEIGHPFGQSQPRERGTKSNYNSLKPVQSTTRTSLPRETSKPAMDGYHSVTRQQQRTRSQGSFLREVQLDGSDDVTVAKTDGPGGRDGISDRPLRRSHRVDQESTAKGPTRTRIPRESVNVRGETRVQMQTKSVGYDDAMKDSPGRHVNDVEHNMDSAAGKQSKAFPDGSTPTPVQTDTGHTDVSQHRISPKPSPTSKDERSILSESMADVLDSGELSPRHSAGRWPSSNIDRAPQQVQKDGSSFGTTGKPKSKKKEERYANRSGPKHFLGAPTKESSKGKLVTRSSFVRSLTALGASARNFSFGVSWAAVQTIVWSFTRLRLIGLVSLSASMGASCLTVVLTMMSWLLMFWLRIHSVALKEATGSIHVSVCFLFPYSFQYLASLVDEWAPHWLPVCLWYSFLMQMFSTSNHLNKSSTASNVVPALRALLPVAFLCEVPSGRSYLLALEGSELLLLSFTLAAVRLRCLLSPIFLFSWSSQVIAIATFGSCASLQYCQLLVSLASLHAVSIVDVTLNSKFYHARYRAGMSLTNGFRIIPPPQHTLLR